MKKSLLALFAVFALAVSTTSKALSQVVTLADAAGDYVFEAGGPANALTAAPNNWNYLGSTAANGGTETRLTAGAVGNQGNAYQGFVGVSGFGTAVVYGTNTASPDQFEIFSNGDVNNAVVGTDLLLHPGQVTNADRFVIARYTNTDQVLAGTVEIAGSFRELVVGGNAAAESVEVFIYQNDNLLFSAQGGTTAQGTRGILEQAAGTFSLTGLSLAVGDRIDFVVGTNGHFGADETALQATISGERISDPAPSNLTISNNFSANFSGVSIFGGVDLSANISAGSGQITQIAFAPGDNTKAYIATFENGIWRYDYDPDNGNFLRNGVKVVEDSTVASPPSPDPRLGTADPNGSLGIAFHDDPNLGITMYIAPAVAFGGGGERSRAAVQPQRIVRLTDQGGNGVFGDQPQDVNQIIVDNVWVNEHHQINQLQIIGDALYVAVGTRTSFGGTGNEVPGETAYNGAVSFIEDLTAIADTTTTNIAGFTIPDFDNNGVIDDRDAQVDSQSFSSNDPGKLRIFSTGMRNIYGIAFDDGGDLWISMNEENADGPDNLYRSQFKDDHLFPKQNRFVGDWKVDGDHDSNSALGNNDPSADALANGYFQTSVAEFVQSNQDNSSFGGLEFFAASTDDSNLRGNILVTQSFDSQVLIMFDSQTAQQTTVLNGSAADRILEIKRDHLGNMLVAGQNGRVTLLHVESGCVLGDINLDGVVSFLDIAPLITLLSDGRFQCEADLDQNGLVNFLDIAPFINLLSQ